MITCDDATKCTGTQSVTQLKTRPDPDAETVLDFVGATYVVKAIALTEIDAVASANNCARLWNPLNESKIDDYHQSMARGDIFPMIVVEAGENGFVVLGGNQRVGAMRRFAVPVVDVVAYVVKPLSDSVRDVVIRSLNSRHGWGSEKEERLEHAVYMVRKHGIATEDAAKLMVVAASSISRRIRADDTRAELGRHGIDAASMPITTLDALSRVANTKAKVALAEIAANCNSTADDVRNVVRGIEKARSVADVTKLVREFDATAKAKKNHDKPNGSRLRHPRREKFMSLLNKMSTFLERENDGTGFSDMKELQCTEDDFEKVHALCAKIVIRLKTIAGV